MGRFSAYIDSISEYRQSRKAIGLSVFDVLIDNSKVFTPGDLLEVYSYSQEAINLLAQKGYDFVLITGQPNRRSRNIEIQDFENILNSMKEMFVASGASMRGSYFTNSIDKKDPYVKPNTGMFKRAEHEKKIVWNETFYVGADINDIKAANSVKTTPILIGQLSETELLSINHIPNLQSFNTLLDFAKAV